METEKQKAVEDAHKARFTEAKQKIVEHYQGQVAEIQINSFWKGAKTYYFKRVVKGYELGLEAGSVPAESTLQAIPDVETPEIKIPSEEEEGEEEEEAAEECRGECRRGGRSGARERCLNQKLLCFTFLGQYLSFVWLRLVELYARLLW